MNRIKNGEAPLTTFADANVGDMFVFQGLTCMKMQGGRCYSLCTGQSQSPKNNATIYMLKEVTITSV